MNNWFWGRAFHSVFFSLRAASSNFVLATAKVQHFLPVCKKKDKKVSYLTFALSQLAVEVGLGVGVQVDGEVGVQVGA